MTRSKLVTWLRLLLPLIALALLSTLFMFSNKPDLEPQIPYTKTEAERQASRQSVVAPEMATVTDDGTKLTLRAQELLPEQGNDGRIRQLRLDITQNNGLTAEVIAPAAAMEGGKVSLSGGAQMKTSTGWSVATESIEADPVTSHLVAPSGVNARAPFGTVEAGRMELGGAQADSEKTTVLNFTDGVRLIYQP